MGTRSIGMLVLLLAAGGAHAQDASAPQIKGPRLSFATRGDLAAFIEAQKRGGMPAFKKLLRAHEAAGFRSLLPVFDRNDTRRVAEFKAFRAAQRAGLAVTQIVPACPLPIMASAPAPSPASRIDQVLDDFDSDPIVADPFFAALLNRDREILVEGTVYKYTERGVLYADEDRYEELRAAANLREAAGPAKGVTPLGAHVSLFAPAPNLIPLPPDNCNPGGGGGGGGGNPPPPPPPPPTKEEVKARLPVCFWDPNIWDDIFGPAESCHDYFESDKRIKTKVWSQNYFIFASVGIKVESQNRFLRIWWADDIDEVELGYTSVYFEYDLPQPVWPVRPYVYQYQYGDAIIDQYGRYVGPAYGGPQSIFEKFPLEDPSKRLLTIYLFEPLETILGKSSIDFTAADVNSGIESLVKQGFNALSSYLRRSTQGTATIVYPNAQRNKLRFLFTNWVRTNANDNKITETFDWNTATIGFSTTGPSVSPIYDSPRSYSRFMAIAYGMGRRGGTWKGSRVVLDDSQ
jgi:hypothetical protein